MRKKTEPGKELPPRHREILSHLIELYISRSEPVGSRTLADTYFSSLSSATIRNCLEEMEKLGYLQKSHASAGRTPTEKGYRHYVTELLGCLDDRDREIGALREKLQALQLVQKDFFRITTQYLAELTHYAAIVMLPGIEQMPLKAIDFIRLGSDKILVVLVFKVGFVENRVIETDRNFSQDELTEYSRYLNASFQSSRSVREVREQVMQEMKGLKDLFDELLEKVRTEFSGREFMMEGHGYLLESPEFSDVREMRRIFKAFDEKGKIVSLLDRSMNAEGVKIYIGSDDLTSDLEGIAMIAAPYGSGDGGFGTLGIVGPVRMDYSKMIPMVRSTARALSQMINIP